ncbi:MAG TPA: hypothetical protein VKZ84_07815 [Bacteriovoracaceae bacterium]|nr:hypothetical protein [Bacteriovoracaceae bacterium]
MKFSYQLIDEQLYLKPTVEEGLFSFNEISFTPSISKDQKPISAIISELDPLTATKLLEVEASRYPNSSRFEELKNIKADFVFHPHEELIFFGGSFNPWHHGHKACLDLLGNRDCIILPDRNPFKEIIHLSPVEIYQEIALKINYNHHYLNPEFILQANKNPTYTWIKRTQERFPNVKLSLLMGMDSLESIETWHQAEELLSTLNSIYVASRLEDQSKQKELQNRLSRFRGLQIKFLGHHPFESLSSTELRNKK